MNKQKKFNQIVRDIKSVKIQGARNVAKKAFYAYKLISTKKSRQKLLSLRPTEPLLHNALKMADTLSYTELSKKLEENQDIINKHFFNLIKNNSVVFTHCHSSTVTKALVYARKKGKKFEVYNTETRPLYQGRKTAKELSMAGIKVTMFVDSAGDVAFEHSQKTRKVDMVVLGADAVIDKGVLNKIGSGMFAELAKNHRIPFYILSDAWKYSKMKVKIEKRGSDEVWRTETKIRIFNPAFELIKKKHITAIVSELGILSHKEFIKKAGKELN
jgi:ribose 1,5-bisphosphate isomerase